MQSGKLLLGIVSLVPLVLSLSVHEWAHAFAADRLGDDTPRREGRLTFNPIPHIDLFGTVLLPLLCILSSGMVFFGWAKPVHVQPSRFRRDVTMNTGMLVTALAGPASNILLALLCTVLYGLGARFDALSSRPELTLLLGRMMGLNLALALFNLIPVPPLDGSRVVDWFLPVRYQEVWLKIRHYSPLLLIGVLMAAPRILAGPLALADRVVAHLLVAVAGGGA